ncbi:response regulator transcription factor [Microbacterium sp. zg-Y818]|uniref:response regulator transcription factor n=1 Tax=unclassified Microbacterium TaxID=2609290 RepID=UPI00214C34AE|nr:MULTISPECIES: response regulator transcription factor [unclassified Microbacterium]MCR2801926.1 response regulator transcription factor [Microbacterium sp. zg.Y818]WIM22816.1 response regulator transcription factor [Microbacterium sp. zg-Y818]
MSDSVTPAKTAVIVEDDPDIRHLLAEVLEAMGFSTVSVGNGLDGVRAVLAYQPLITTLDVTMPGIDGFEAARRIRAQSDTYIIMLTGLEDEADVVLGFGSGADEYINKPFRPRELRARIDALLRRPRIGGNPPAAPRQDQVGPSFPGARPGTSSIPVQRPAAEYAAAPARAATIPPPAPDQRTIVMQPSASSSGGTDVVRHDDTAALRPEPDVLVHRDLEVDPDTRIVVVAGAQLELTRTEFDLLSTLMESKRRVRSKADLTLVLRGESYVTSYYVGDADKRAIEAHMTNLRRKLGDNAANPRYIETVRGVGYRMTSESLA